jgi:pyruvate dehydrogenase E1 component
MLPIYLFYSMFGFQRTGDLMWLLGDIRGRGILAGCTAGRTTLQGEGLQHDDGHSPLLASVNPAARIYDPAFAYEIAVIMEEAVARTLGPDPEDRFWYLTLYNENYVMPPLPTGPAGDIVRAGILRGIYRFAGPADVSAMGEGGGEGIGVDPGVSLSVDDEGGPLSGPGPAENGARRATLLFSGPMWRAAMEARDILARDWSVSADVWSVTSYTELRHDALSAERANRLHPGNGTRTPYVTEVLGTGSGPVVAVTDYLRAVPDQVARWVARPYTSLGTDGFGRSDTRGALRRFFEVDAAHIVVAVLAALAQLGEAKTDEVAEAIATYGIDPDAADPWAV